MAKIPSDSESSEPKTDQKLEGHSYDGIEELDNSLPAWWLNGFYLTIIFSVGYVFYYAILEGPSLVREYENSRNKYEIAQLSSKAKTSVADESELRSFLKDPNRIQAGQAVFQSKCVSCHGPQGQGGIGPNLTDEYWIHGGKMTEILNVVMNGVLDKGMPPWGPVLKQDEIYSVVTYIKSIRGSNPPNPKPPQGELIKE